MGAGGAPTRVVQLANLGGAPPGSLAATVEELGRRYVELGLDRFLVVPGPADTRASGPSGWRIEVRSPVVPGAGGRRALTPMSGIGEVLGSLRPDVIEVSDPLTLAWAGRWGRRAGVPTVLVSHRRVDQALAARLPRRFPVHRTADAFNRRLARSVDVVVCTSDYAGQEFARAGAANVVRVPLGGDLDVFHPGAAKPPVTNGGRAGGPAEVVYVGRLARDRRPGLVVSALRVLRGRGVAAHLTVVGDGPLRPELGRLAAGLPVTFAGRIDDRLALAAVLSGADVAVAPSAGESFGLSALEALACGTPVVVIDGTAAAELVDGRCGLAVGPTVAAVAGAVGELSAPPVEQRRAAARRRACRYPWTRTAAGMRLAHELAARSGAGDVVHQRQQVAAVGGGGGHGRPDDAGVVAELGRHDLGRGPQQGQEAAMVLADAPTDDDQLR
ncbi:MAG TPA: glycosyltransferase [Acidimicrobiales bacterium]|nr:glycosyltransferase [Acidimicrobiales bacterium]